MVRRVVAAWGTKRAVLLLTALVAVVVLVPILLVATSGSGKPKPKAAVASTGATTSTPTSTTHVRAAKRHAKARAHHRHARHAAAVKHPSHRRHKTPSKSGAATPRTTQTTAATTTSTPQATSTPTSITFDLLGRSGDATSSVCGAPRHYHTYPTGETLGISGRVKPIPSAHWKVKVKIEVCSGATFTDYVKIEPTINKHTGAFSGSFPAPAAGFYRARAELYVNDVRTVDSADDHFKTH